MTDKDCNNCKHRELAYDDEPCVVCFGFPTYDKWEPAE